MDMIAPVGAALAARLSANVARAVVGKANAIELLLVALMPALVGYGWKAAAPDLPGH
ncbi:MAG TPA: hypothetical protein VKI44_16500 [Acetobacteraceae bacterium]|nr:hypothetical protein [Acetobacteraceae bacterium]